MRYSFDTSSLMNPWNWHYPRNIFPTVWSRIEDLILAGHAHASTEVQREIDRKDDDLKAWVNQRVGFFVPVDTAIQTIVADILTNHPTLIDPHSTKSAGDPWVIALAEQHGLILVTEENLPGPNSTKIKIPNVCQARNIPCINLRGLMLNEGWTF